MILLTAPPTILTQPVPSDHLSPSTPTTPRFRRFIPWGERVLIVAVTLLAAYLRFVALTAGQWRNDEEIIWLEALRTVASGRFPWVGIPSDLGLANGPAQLLPVLAAALLRSTYVAYVLVASLNVLAVAALYRLGRAWGGPWLGLTAAVVAATSPWAVIHSRRLWGNDMLAPFAVLVVTALWRLAAQRQRWRLVEVAVWLAVLLQMYVAAVVQLATVAVGLVFTIQQHGRGSVRRLLVPAVVALLTFLALVAGYALVALLPHGSDLLRAVHDPRADTPAAVGLPNWDGFGYLLRTVGMDGYQYYAGPAAALADTRRGPAGWASRCAVALFLFGCAAALRQLARGIGNASPAFRRDAVAPALLLVWTFALPAALIIHNGPVCACFLLPSYPAQYLVVALGAVALGQGGARALRLVARNGPASTPGPLRRAGPAITSALVAFVVLNQIGAALPFFRAVTQYWPDDRYGLPLIWHQRIVTMVADAWRPGTTLVVSGHSELDGVLRDELDTRLPGVAPRVVDDQRWLALPGSGQPPMLVLVTPGSTPAHLALERFAQQHPAARRGALTVPGAGEAYAAIVLTSADTPAFAALLAPAATDHPLGVAFADDATLDRLALAPRLLPDQPTPVVLQWTIRRTTPLIPAASFYVHLVAADGATAAALDAPFPPPGLWRRGERIWTFGSLRDPGGGSGLRDALVGLYVLRGKDAANGVIPIQATDAAGHSLDAVRVGPFVTRAAVTAPPAPQGRTLVPNLALTAIDAPLSARPGSALPVTLHWQALAGGLPRYTAFVHLVNSAGALKAQQDGEPNGGAFPTTTWLPDETIRDQHAVPLPVTLAPGQYRLVVGLYPTGQPDKPAAVTAQGVTVLAP